VGTGFSEKIMLKQKLERDDVSTKFPLRDESVSPARASVRRGDDRQERHQEEKTDVITASAAAQMPLRPANAAKSSTNEIACFATETDRSGLFIGPIAGRWRGHFCLGSTRHAESTNLERQDLRQDPFNLSSIKARTRPQAIHPQVPRIPLGKPPRLS